MVKVVLFSIILANTRKRYALLSVEPEYKNIFLFPLNRITSLQFLLLAVILLRCLSYCATYLYKRLQFTGIWEVAELILSTKQQHQQL